MPGSLSFSAVLFGLHAFLRVLGVFAVAALIAGCASQPLTQSSQTEDDDDAPTVTQEEAANVSKLPTAELTPQILYQFLLGEIAAQRGQLPVSVSAYQMLSKTTADPRIAQRAAEIALFAKQYDVALASARIWADGDPDARQAQAMVATLLAASNRLEEAKAYAKRLMALTPSDKRAAALMQLSGLYSRSRDTLAAYRDLIDLTAPYSGFPEAHFVRALAALRANDKTNAAKHIAQALHDKPDWEQAALLQAQINGDNKTALPDLAAFVARNPNAFDVRLIYARILATENQLEAARREFIALQALQPANVELIYADAVLSRALQDYDRARVQFERLAGGDNMVGQQNAFFNLGQLADRLNQSEQALSWYEKVLPGKDYFVAQIRVAALLSKQGRNDEALRRLEAAQEKLKTDDERIQAVQVRLQLLRESGQHENAYALLRTFLTRWPQNPDLLYEAMLSADKLGKLDDLERHFHDLVAQRPDYAHAYNAFGYSLADRAIRLPEAEKWIDKALHLAPTDPFILDSKGWLLFRQGKLDAALETLKKALSERPDPEIAAHCGEVLWNLGQREAARKVWENAARDHPDNAALKMAIERHAP